METHAFHQVVAEHFFRGFIEVHGHAQVFNLAHQQPRSPAFIDLPGHEARGEFHHMRIEAEIIGRLGGFQAEQAAADDGSAFDLGSVVDNAFEIFNGAVDEHAAFVDARHRRHEGV